MTFEYIQQLIAKDERRCLELKKTTGELQDGMHSACVFLNTDGGWLIFGVAPKSLKILGQQVSGVSRMVDACREQGVPEPEYEVMESFVKIVFRRATEKLDGGVNGGNVRLNKRQMATLEFIRLHEGHNTRRISEELNVPFDTIDKHIRVLLKNDLIEHRGSAKTGGYYVKEHK